MTYGGLDRYVCDDDWGIEEANVVCNMLGFDGALEARERGYYGVSGGFFLDSVNCTGDESNLLYCVHGGLGYHDCKEGEVAGVVCTPSSNRYFL